MTDRAPRTRTRGDDRERAAVIEEHGEDPRRFLQADLKPDDGDGAHGMLMLARIRGIRDLELWRAWYEEETSREGGPRKKVLQELEDVRENHMS